MTKPSSTRLSSLIAGIPHAVEIGLTALEEDTEGVLCVAPYDARFVGNPDTRIVHGGLIATMLDSACGFAVMTRTGRVSGIATLDLRIDYMRPATPGKDIFVHAACFKVATSIAFVRGFAYDAAREDPIATCVATFMLGTKSRKGSNLLERSEP